MPAKATRARDEIAPEQLLHCMLVKVVLVTPEYVKVVGVPATDTTSEPFGGKFAVPLAVTMSEPVAVGQVWAPLTVVFGGVMPSTAFEAARA